VAFWIAISSDFWLCSITLSIAKNASSASIAYLFWRYFLHWDFYLTLSTAKKASSASITWLIPFMPSICLTRTAVCLPACW
jgi:hypothetical protein